MNIRRFISKARDASLRDYLAFFPMLAGLVLSVFFRRRYKDTWGICDRDTSAQDNGYHFFRYMAREHPEQPCIFVINKNCGDYIKVRDWGEVVQFGSLKHWILYFTCRYLISSQTFRPNGYIGVFLERSGLFRPDNVFLQHGITINRAEYLMAGYKLVRYFIAGAEPEYEFMKEEFGHPEGTIQYTGFPRFDSWHDFRPASNRILVMPTWRKWLRFKSETHQDAQMNIQSSDYLLCWRKLLQSPHLHNLIRQYDLEIIFYPHPNMKGILNPEDMAGPDIHIADSEHEDLQELMKTSRTLITDYSSVFFDMAYMKKPVIFYQFDEDKFRKYHYQQGWFDYHATSFGQSFKDSDDVISELRRLVEGGFSVSEEFMSEHARTFKLYDTKNSERIYYLLIRE